MEQVIIENPILNSPFEEPKRHFRFSDEGITNEIAETRRVSSYFIPIAKPKKKGKSTQLAFDTEWTQDRIEENIFIQMLLLKELAYGAADRIYNAIVASEEGPKYLKPILRPYDHIGSTRYVDFDTTRPVYPTDPAKCHVSRVVADTESWEQKMAHALEEMDEVVCYVKNHNLGFTIPYTLNGEEKNYIPDFIVCIQDGDNGPLNLIIEVTGEKRKDKAAKVSTARNLWVPAVNNHGDFGRWTFSEISDPWDAKNLICAFLKSNVSSPGEVQ